MMNIPDIKNLISAGIKHVGDGFQNVPSTQYQQRMLICAQCDKFDNDWCRECGCYLKIKATWRTAICPLGKWPDDSTIIQSVASGDCGGCNAKQS